MKKMLTKEECNLAIECLTISALEGTHFDNRKYVLNNYEEIKQLINEHFELVKENERLSTQLVECQRVCQVKQERINELAKGTVNYVD